MLIRVARTARVTLTHTFTVDETATDAAGNVTVTLTRLDGSTAGSGGGIATHTGTGVYTFTLDASQVVDTWIVDWSGTLAGATVHQQDIVEIVGGFYFGLDEARHAHPQALGSTATWPSALLAQKRTQVEQECDRITGRAFVPRFARLVLDGSGRADLVLPDVDLRTLRAASIASTSDGQFVALTAGELAAVAVSPSGVLTRRGGLWPCGNQNVIVEYEYGRDWPPEDIRAANLLRIRSVATSINSGIPDRALSFTVTDGGVYRLSVPGPKATGIPDVDAAYTGLQYAIGFA